MVNNLTCMIDRKAGGSELSESEPLKPTLDFFVGEGEDAGDVAVLFLDGSSYGIKILIFFFLESF